jgi:hypothetical protein
MKSRSGLSMMLLGVVVFLGALSLTPSAYGTALYNASVVADIGFADPGVPVQLVNFQQDLFTTQGGTATNDASGLTVSALAVGNTDGPLAVPTSFASSTLTFGIHNLTGEPISVGLTLDQTNVFSAAVDDPASELARIAITRLFTVGGLPPFETTIDREAPPNFDTFSFSPVSTIFEIGPDGTVPVSLRVTAFGFAQAVPEPASLVLTSVGLTGLVVLRWRAPRRR